MKKKKLFCNFTNHLEFIYDCDIEQLAKYLWRKYKCNIKEDTNFFDDGKFVSIEKNGYIYRYIWVRNKKDIAVITHELIHAAVDILEFAGIPINFENSDTLAYLVESFFRQIQQIKKK